MYSILGPHRGLGYDLNLSFKGSCFKILVLCMTMLGVSETLKSGVWRLTGWLNRLLLNLHLWCQHPIWASVHVPDALLLILLPAHGLEK